jgi:hypothetical protein
MKQLKNHHDICKWNISKYHTKELVQNKKCKTKNSRKKEELSTQTRAISA